MNQIKSLDRTQLEKQLFMLKDWYAEMKETDDFSWKVLERLRVIIREAEEYLRVK